ncbi:hypothetical protein Mapa_003359 [Marchantia paleacea]|nr:hypothetical protein Mapa_003359 [Marchantia paleacea]
MQVNLYTPLKPPTDKSYQLPITHWKQRKRCSDIPRKTVNSQHILINYYTQQIIQQLVCQNRVQP